MILTSPDESEDQLGFSSNLSSDEAAIYLLTFQQLWLQMNTMITCLSLPSNCNDDFSNTFDGLPPVMSTIDRFFSF